MEELITTAEKNTKKTVSKADTLKDATVSASQSTPRSGMRKNPRRIVRREDRVRSEFTQKIISIRRVTRVVKGGRRFSFSVVMVLGDKKGRVGVGSGKGTDTALAIEKAIRSAKKNMFRPKLTKKMSIPHDISAKYGASQIQILPAPGRGLVAGSSVRTVLELAGIKDVTAKIFSRSKNKLNNAQATVKALQQLMV